MSPGQKAVEHFVTLFDDSFLPIGLAQYQSLAEHAAPFHLWVATIDDAAEQHLQQLALPNLSVIPLRDIETPELLEVKPGRTRGEYCWTITPFVCEAVFQREPTAQRVTYLDSDVWFLADPRILLSELEHSRKHVLITEHAFAPEYDRSHDSGRFCVQFLTFDRTAAATRVMEWWQERCLEWCFARYEDGKFGDQAYLNRWPDLFGKELRILEQTDKTLAPWNVRYFAHKHAWEGANWKPVLFHFHGFRLLGPESARLYRFYNVGSYGDGIYNRYLRAVGAALSQLRKAGIETPYHTLPPERFGAWHRLMRKLQRTERYAALP